MLACRPTAHGYGSAVAEILNTLHLARHLRTSAFFVRPRRPLNHAIFHLVSPDVPVVPQRGWHALSLHAAWLGRHAWPDARAALRTALLLRGKRRLAREGLSKAARRRTKDLMGRVAAWPATAPPQPALAAALAAIDFRREYAEAPVRVTLPPREAAAAARAAAALGIDPGRPIVTLHARESGYKVSLGLPERVTDVMRNATIARYRPAVRWLLAEGFQVVRVGDATCSPLDVDGAIDLARSPARTETLELWCVKQSRFFLVSDSGPYMAAILLNTPTLAVNVTALLGGDPLRSGDRYILKHVTESATSRPLTLGELLAPEYLINFRVPGRYTHHENTADEILAAVQDMVRSQAGTVTPTDAQLEFGRRLAALAAGDAVSSWRGEAGLPALYVGRGLVSAPFVARGFDRPFVAEGDDDGDR